MQMKTLALVLSGALAMVAAETSAHAKKFRLDANGGRGGDGNVVFGDGNIVGNGGNGGSIRGKFAKKFGHFGSRFTGSANGGRGGDGNLVIGNGNAVGNGGDGGDIDF